MKKNLLTGTWLKNNYAAGEDEDSNSSLSDDLRRGYSFYDAQELGLGDYFQDSLF